MSYGAADANAGGVNCDGDDGVGDLLFVALVLLRVGLGPRVPHIVLLVVFFFVIFYVPLYIILRKK